MVYYVVGGVFTDTTWQEVGVLDVFGPYDTYDDARNKWASEMWLNVDNCLHRLVIVEV